MVRNALPQPHPADLRSYGRRRGRKPSDRQARLLRDVLPRLAVDLNAPCSPVDQDASHAAPQTWLEIGFGGGEHLVWQARQNPDVAIIGCEPFEDGVVKVLTSIEDEGLHNIRIHMGDARDVLRALPRTCIARCFILFPDPWPKRKHVKRRLVNGTTLALLADAMITGAELRIGTDIGDYARTILEAMRGEPRFRWSATSPSDWRIRPSDWPPTRYEGKAAEAGRQRYYFRFQRT